MTEKKVLRQAIKRKFPAVDINETLATAVNEMSKADVSVLAVKSGNDIIGLVTTNDIMFSLASEDGSLQTQISSFMTKCEVDVSRTTRTPCIQLDENDEVLSAIKVMYDTGVNHLLVSGSNGEVVGIVSSLDLIKVFSSND